MKFAQKFGENENFPIEGKLPFFKGHMHDLLAKLFLDITFLIWNKCLENNWNWLVAHVIIYSLILGHQS